MAEPLPTPAGLEVLESTTHLFIKQLVEVTEILSGFETKNKYEIINSKGERIFFAVETTNYCLICCCCTSRPFKFKVIDFTGKTIMRIERPCSCTSCCGCRMCFCGLFDDSKINVTLADETETLLGQVAERCAIFSPTYVVRDGALKDKLEIKGPKWAFCCTCKLMGNVEFKIKGLDGAGEHCGRISKEFDGLEFDRYQGHSRVSSDADNYGICFPLEMDPRMKATLLGAVLLIDFMYFENDPKKPPRYEPPVQA